MYLIHNIPPFALICGHLCPVLGSYSFRFRQIKTNEIIFSSIKFLKCKNLPVISFQIILHIRIHIRTRQEENSKQFRAVWNFASNAKMLSASNLIFLWSICVYFTTKNLQNFPPGFAVIKILILTLGLIDGSKIKKLGVQK